MTAWNAAFERAGYASAVRALLPDDPDWPEDYAAGDLRYASISWAVSTDATYAIAPHTVDPRSGEILDADVMLAHSWVSHWLGEYEEFAREAAVAFEPL